MYRKVYKTFLELKNDNVIRALKSCVLISWLKFIGNSLDESVEVASQFNLNEAAIFNSTFSCRYNKYMRETIKIICTRSEVKWIGFSLSISNFFSIFFLTESSIRLDFSHDVLNTVCNDDRQGKVFKGTELHQRWKIVRKDEDYPMPTSLKQKLKKQLKKKPKQLEFCEKRRKKSRFQRIHIYDARFYRCVAIIVVDPTIRFACKGDLLRVESGLGSGRRGLQL